MKQPYSEAFREKMVQRMLGPDAVSANRLAQEVGIHQATLSRWLRAAHRSGMGDQDKHPPPPVAPSPPRTAEDKLRLVLAAEAIAPDELGAFLRREGVHQSELETWRTAVRQAATAALSGAAPVPARSADSRRIKELERELRRKDRALAETAALLVLAKKAEALWGDVDDDTDDRSAK